MSYRSSSFLAVAAIAALTLGATACTKAEETKAENHAEAAADKAAGAVDHAGEVIESGAMKTAQAVENTAGDVADHLEARQAEAAAAGRPGAVDPATDQRVPAPSH